jgi:hypothetical protein
LQTEHQKGIAGCGQYGLSGIDIIRKSRLLTDPNNPHCASYTACHIHVPEKDGGISVGANNRSAFGTFF